MTTNTAKQQLMEIAARIKEMREIMGWSIAEMAVKTAVSEEQYIAYETAEADIPFSFIHKCALEFGVEITEFLEGHNAARLSSYTVTRKGQGLQTAKEEEVNSDAISDEKEEISACETSEIEREATIAVAEDGGENLQDTASKGIGKDIEGEISLEENTPLEEASR